MSVEKYIAGASLGLFIMFVGEIVIFYNFMISYPTLDIAVSLEPEPKMLQFISIGVAPAMIMAGVSFIMSKRYGSKSIGMMIISGGAILLVGMAFAYTQLSDIDSQYLVDAVTITPILFMVVSIPIMVVGALLLKTRDRKPKKEYV